MPGTAVCKLEGQIWHLPWFEFRAEHHGPLQNPRTPAVPPRWEVGGPWPWAEAGLAAVSSLAF